jgi:formylglycine-generating enzyme required for sulfatase activity
VWTELGYHIDSAQMPYRAADGEVQFYEESYSSCSNFIEAYMQSLFNEVQYVLLGLPEERPTASDAMTGGVPRQSRDHVVRRVQAFAKYKLRDAMSVDGGSDIMTDDDQELLAEYKSLQAATDDVDYIVKELRRGYGRQVDHRLQQTFKKGQLGIEPVLFLERLMAAIGPDHRPEDGVPLRSVVYPRRWKSVGGQARGRRLMGTAVPWESCPVTGISFFEALAFAGWLSSVSGEPLTLPTEAQYERASSWPYDRGVIEGKPVKLDYRKKLLFPWQDHCENDFNYFFGREGFEVEGYYQKDRRKYKEVMDSTARTVAEGRTLYQLEGFGWHWTVDRYSETERKYSRFQDPDYPKYTARPCIEPPGERTMVYDYAPNRNPKDPFFVLKGSPDVVGGPGLTTRRYATYPLRGYFNVGFRLVREET